MIYKDLRKADVYIELSEDNMVIQLYGRVWCARQKDFLRNRFNLKIDDWIVVNLKNRYNLEIGGQHLQDVDLDLFGYDQCDCVLEIDDNLISLMSVLKALVQADQIGIYLFFTKNPFNPNIEKINAALTSGFKNGLIDFLPDSQDYELSNRGHSVLRAINLEKYKKTPLLNYERIFCIRYKDGYQSQVYTITEDNLSRRFNFVMSRSGLLYSEDDSFPCEFNLTDQKNNTEYRAANKRADIYYNFDIAQKCKTVGTYTEEDLIMMGYNLIDHPMLQPYYEYPDVLFWCRICHDFIRLNNRCEHIQWDDENGGAYGPGLGGNDA